jgi:hypothetical protein
MALQEGLAYPIAYGDVNKDDHSNIPNSRNKASS